MRRLFILVIPFFFFPSTTFAQKPAKIWYFGKNAGLDFSSGSPRSINGSVMNQWEGCSIVGDSTGRVILYSDGIWVWNGQHQVPVNGQELMGEVTSTQSALLVPEPGSTTRYYLFTTARSAMRDGLYYNIIDMSRQNGMGEVVEKNVLIHRPNTEKLTAYPHRNGRDLWIITHPWNSFSFHAYLLTPDGLNTIPVVSTTGVFHGVYDPLTGAGYWDSQGDYIGYLRISPDGRRLAVALKDTQIFELFDFDNQTGKVSNPITIQDPQLNTPYGVEFSPDGTKLYGTTDGSRKLVQWDLSAGSPQAIIASQTLIAQVGVPGENLGGAVQLGSDGKIYVAKLKSPTLGAIYQPNAKGVACNYQDNGVTLGNGLSHFGLPNMVASSFKLPDITWQGVCHESLTHFSVTYPYQVDSVRWYFGDPSTGAANTVTTLKTSHRFSQPGTYQVTLLQYRHGTADTYTQTVTIRPLPRVDLGRDTTLCARNELRLIVNVPGAAYRWSDGSTANSLTVTESGLYWVEVLKDSCTFKDSIQVNFMNCPLLIPNVFTPNADQVNDTFEIAGLVYGKWKLEVYDRWGKQVFRSTGYQNNWSGQGLNNGIYYYLLTDPQLQKRYQGWVQILR